MTPQHTYPATLPAQAQEGIEDIVSRLHAYLVQREVAHKELERQNGQLSKSLQAERWERTKAEQNGAFYQDAYEDLVERLCSAFNCPNPNAIVEHIQALFEETQRSLAECRALLTNAASGGRDDS